MIKEVENRVAEVLKHYGLGDAEANIVAVLSTHGKMNAKEISKETGYAYSTVVNALNFLKRIGFIEKDKSNRICIYSANIDFIKIMENDRRRLSNLLNDLREEIKKVEGKYKYKLSNLISRVEATLKYLKKIEEVV